MTESRVKVAKGYIGPIHIPRRFEDERGFYWFRNHDLYRCCESRARAGDSDAAAILAFMYLTGAIQSESWKEDALRWALMPDQLEGSSGYCYFAQACAYFELSSTAEMVAALRQSASLGFSPAEWVLGKAHQFGLWVDESPELASAYFTKARSKRFVLASSSLFDLWKSGELGVGRQVAGMIGEPLSLIYLRVRHIFGNKLDEHFLFYMPIIRYIEANKP